jgi:5-methylcytosine-specific restriction enzyme B
MSYSETKIKQIIHSFEKWFANDIHSKIEDFYKETITEKYLSSLSQKEFEDYFLEFAKHGGKIQSGGARTANKLIENIHNNFAAFKQKVLEPFGPEFDLYEWLKWTKSFKFFGQGIATIYLNRVDKRKFVIVNNKSIEAYKKLGYQIPSSPLIETYNAILYAQTDLIKKNPELDNYFRADALSHFLIATPEGLDVSKVGNSDFKIKNLSKNDIEFAIHTIDSNPSLRKGRESIEYDLINDEKRYPPILVLSEANKVAGGQDLLLSDFGNSVKNAFSILELHGYKIEKKVMDFSGQINKFLTQSETNDLATSGYVKDYQNLKVRVGFGQGNPARITWIAFLADKQSVSNGIYPVYLYFKKIKLLILAYGISENNKPTKSWNQSKLQSINEYFIENQLDGPERYGTSYVYKIYQTNDPIEPDLINKDLNVLIDKYKQELLLGEPEKQNAENMEFNFESFKTSSDSANLLFNNNLVLRFVAGLLTKPFIILTGLSGSGKTKLAQAFSEWISENKQQYSIIPVGADWSNREPLLGYPNGLDNESYILPDSGALQLILEASREINQNKPFFLILDEMNLSHVERYFADFLSIMETGKTIKLYDGDTRKSGHNEIAKEITWPKNLFIIGTVNIDETTYMFSPKVLDRSNVIEFRVSPHDMELFLQNKRSINIDKLHVDDECDKPGLGSTMAADFLKIAGLKPYSERASTALKSFFPLLQKVGAEFGYRSANEIGILVGVLEELTKGAQFSDKDDGEPLTEKDFIDIAIMQKLLPKLHGSRTKLVPVLSHLGVLCISLEKTKYDPEKDKENKQFIKDFLDPNEIISNSDGISIVYPISFDKIRRMYKNVLSNGFTSYAEA